MSFCKQYTVKHRKGSIFATIDWESFDIKKYVNNAPYRHDVLKTINLIKRTRGVCTVYIYQNCKSFDVDHNRYVLARELVFVM